MNVKLIPIVVAPLLVYGLVIGSGSLANREPQRARQRFNISRYGSLLELFDADGKSLTKRILGDGFMVNYKTRGKSRSASSLGMKTKGLQTSSEPVKLEGNRATAIAETADKSLEITSIFSVDASTGELIIKRRFRNISKNSVTLLTVRNYVDPRVVVRGGLGRYKDLNSAALSQIKAGLYPDDCGAGECPVGPLCPYPILCPPEPEFYRAVLYPPKKQVLLEWPTDITLKPKQNQRPAGEANIIIRVAIK